MSSDDKRTKLEDWLLSHFTVNIDPWVDNECTSPVNQCRQVYCDPTVDREDEGVIVHGTRDSMGRLEGSVELHWDNGDSFSGSYIEGTREGWGIVTSKERNIQALTGVWVDGYLTGKGRMVTSDTSVIEGWFSNSCLHGPVRKIVLKKFKTFRQQVTWLGHYHSGVPVGRCWQWTEGDGYITGIVDSGGQFTGDKVVFIFSDLETALFGTFIDGVMVSAISATLESVRLINDIAEPVFSLTGSDTVGYCKSGLNSVGDNPLVRDPYERKTCKVRASTLGGGGEGLFAARSLSKGDIVAFYNGVRLPYVPGEKEDWESSGYKIFVNADHSSGERMDLPGDLVNIDRYCATLGHKVNHNFNYNTKEGIFHHPRHGLIPCIVTITDIQEGEELFLHYGYDPENCPKWYKLELERYLTDNPELDMWDVANPDRLEDNKSSWREEILS